MFNNQTVVEIDPKYQSIITKYYINPNKLLKRIYVDDNSLGKMIGNYKNSVSVITDADKNITEKTYRYRFVCYECIDDEIRNGREKTITKSKVIDDGKEIDSYRGINSNSKYVITVNKIECNSNTNIIYDFNENNEGLCVKSDCSTSNGVRCPQMNYDLQVSNEIKYSISEYLKSAITRIDISKKKIERPLKKFNHIFVASGGQNGMSNEQQEWEILEDKFHLLSYEKKDTYFVLGLVKSQNNSLYTSRQLKEIAKNAIENNNQDKTKNIVLVLINSSRFESILGETSTVCANLGFAESNTGLTDSQYITSTGESVKDVMSIYASIAKPLIVNKYYQYANGTLQNYLLKSKKDERGYPFIKVLKFYQSKALAAARSKENSCYYSKSYCEHDCSENSKDNDELKECDYTCSNNYINCISVIPNIIERGLEKEYAINGLKNMSLWNELNINALGKFREIYMDFDGSNGGNDSQNSIDYTKNITLKLFMKSVDAWKWWSTVEIATNWNTELSPEYFYGFSKLKVLDDVIYGTIDILGMIPGVDTFADPIGAIYAGVRGDATNSIIYSASFAIPFAGAAYIKGGAKATKLDGIYGVVAKKANNADGFVLEYKKINEITAQDFHVTSVIHSVDGKLKNKIPLDDIKGYANKPYIKSKVDELASGIANASRWIDELGTLSTAQKVLFKADNC